MEYIQLQSIPQVQFAHFFHSEKYNARLKPKNAFIEISYVAEGELALEQNGQHYTAHAGDFICNLYKDTLHIQAPAFHAHATVGFEAAFALSSTYAPGYIPLKPVLRFSNAAGCRRILEEVIRGTTAPYGDLKSAGLLLQLLDALSTGCVDGFEASADPYNPYVNGAKRYIHENLSRMLRQEEIAAHLKITPEYLCAVFKRSTGESVIPYINRLKLRRIVSLMERENISLRQASEMFGYTDPSYVSRLYRKYFGTSISRQLKADSSAAE